VWLANLRGVAPYGRQHIDLTDVMADFWRFSFHEHGAYDLPAIIDHMAEVTGGEQQARGGGGGPGADEEQMHGRNEWVRLDRRHQSNAHRVCDWQKRRLHPVEFAV